MLVPTLTTDRRHRDPARSHPSDGNAPPAPASAAQPDVRLTRRQARNRPHTSPGPRAHSADNFEAAARLFSFAPSPPDEANPTRDDPARTAPGEQAPAGHKNIARHGRRRAVFFSVQVFGLVAAMTVGMTVDAEALPHEHAAASTDNAPGGLLGKDIQAYVTPAQTPRAQAIIREGYSAATLVDLAGTAGIINFSAAVFTNDPDCAIQWPYAVGVPMTYGFGMRDGKMHDGTDFVPGAGAHIQAIADGIVSLATDTGGAYGVTIVIDHIVDGQAVSSRYAHMEYDSRQVEVGATVSVGQYIGRTGNTGRSFGAHLHFEVLRNGTTATDPLPWLQTYATC